MSTRNITKMRGVTLVELMVVVVVLGILAIIAYPGYQEFVARAKRTEAKAALLQIANKQEAYYLSNSTYTTDMTKLGFRWSAAHVTDSGAYSVTVTAAGPNDYTVVATYLLGGKEATKCLTFNINAALMTTSAPSPTCWINVR